jgi:predicted negative regulator of RcsB-dependent stress response
MEEIFEDNVAANVKSWWNKHGNVVIGTLVLAIAITVGHQFYQQQQINTVVAASMLYDEYQQSLIGDKEDALKASAAVLRKDFPQSAYATAVALLEASRASFEERYADAEADLVWLQQNGKPFAKPLATLRLAQIKTNQKDYAGALAVLDAMPINDKTPEAGYLAGFEELRGDIAAMQGDRAKAGAHYAKALAAYKAQDFNNVLLQMKTETYH